ncbi:MoaD/ThiS family protein [Chryseobacterium sp.]|uniref:MoaD/ThiS family protein n=1 Tax=Chryseobacterium sp. TaxID=1871047 RepID=UPI002898EFA9|nr:MoaD/ThiS family protein [Chryseobacterium sp.]
MKIKLNYYGKLTDITKTSSETIDIEEMNVLSLKEKLGELYQSFRDMTYQFAENNTMLEDKDVIQSEELDVFPPFSGG